MPGAGTFDIPYRFLDRDLRSHTSPVDADPGRCVAGGAWEPFERGVVTLPSGRRLRGRGLRQGDPGDRLPQFGLYLLGEPPAATDWPARWLRWPDFRLPSDRSEARAAFREVWERAVTERVELACHGGVGRTGTALACVAVIDGVPAASAVAWVRAHYDPRAVETPWQRRYVARFTA